MPLTATWGGDTTFRCSTCSNKQKKKKTDPPVCVRQCVCVMTTLIWRNVDRSSSSSVSPPPSIFSWNKEADVWNTWLLQCLSIYLSEYLFIFCALQSRLFLGFVHINSSLHIWSCCSLSCFNFSEKNVFNSGFIFRFSYFYHFYFGNSSGPDFNTGHHWNHDVTQFE